MHARTALETHTGVRSRWFRILGATLGAVLALTTLQLTGPLASAAVADTAPQPANDPTNPETVSAKPLPTVQIDGVVWSQAVVGNTVYVAGQFNTARPAGAAAGVNTVVRSSLLAYDITTGNLLDNWVANANGVAQVVTASPDGKHIYVGGTFTTITGSNGTAVTRRRIASLDPVTGAVQNGFNPNPDAKVNAIVATNSTVYFGGAFGTAGAATRTRLAAWQPTATGNGNLLPWAPAAVGGAVAALTITPDGQKVIAGGQFTTVNGSGNPGYGMAALDPTSGALVPWAAAATIRNGGATAGINSLTIDNDSVYATGFTFGSGGNLEGTARINNDGTVNWVEDCHGDTYSSYPLNGVVYKVGHAHYCGNVPGGFSQPATWRFFRGLALSKQAAGVARADYLGYANWAGTKDPALLQWYPQLDAGSFTGQTQAAWSLAGNSSYVVAGGEFPKADGTAQQGLVRYATKTVAGDKEGPELTFGKWIPTVTTPGSGQALISWQTNYDRDSRNLTYKVYRNGVEINSQTAGSNIWDRPYLNYLDTAQTPGTTINYRVSAFDSAGNEARSNTIAVTIPGTGTGPDAYSQAVLKDGPQSYWRMDEASGTSMADYTGLDPMTAQAGVTRTTSGAISGRGAASFNGTTSQTAASGTLQEGPWWFTVEAWFKTSSSSSVGRIVGFSGSKTGTSAANTYDRAIYMSSGGKLNFGAKQSSLRIVTTNGSYNDNKWHHVVGVIGDSGTNLYVDGTLAANRQDLRTSGSYSGYWRVGGDTLSGWGNRPTNDYFSGSIDDVAVYQQALTGNQVRNHYVASGATSAVPADNYGKAVYNSGPDLFWRFGETSGTTAADSSLNGQTGTYAGGTTLGGASGVNVNTDKSITLNGTNGNVASANTALTAPPVYSEEAWFKTSSTTGGQLIGFGSSKTGASSTYDRQVYLTNSGTLKFAVSPGNVDTSIESPSGTAYNDNQWHHVVASQGPNGMKLYVDGMAVATGDTPNSLSYNGYWRVGGDNLTGRSSKPTSTYLSGSVDEVAVYPTVLTAAEVQAHFTKGGGVTPNQLPVASFTSTKSYLKASFDGSASSDPDGTIASYDWDFGDGTAHGSGATPEHTYDAAGTYNVKLTVTDNQSGANSVTNAVVVVANVAPTAGFSSSTSANTASFDASTSSDSDGTVASYDWDFGDGSAHGTGKTATHSYNAGGTYHVTLVVTDDQGKASTGLTQDVTVTDPPLNQSPTAAFGATPTQLSVAFDSTGTADPDGSIASYDWDYGDSTTHGSTANPTHQYAAPGTYTVKLTVTDNQGATGTVSHDVTVSGPIATDAFGRTSASGWGNAQTGGAWTPVTGAAANFPVNGSAGQMKVASNSTRAIALNSVAGTDTDTVVNVALDQLPTAGSYEYVIVGSRQQNSGGYRVRVKINGDGTLGLTLQCQAVTGGTCVKSTVGTLATVSGVTVTAGAKLNIRFQTQGSSTATLRSRVWVAGTTEPTTWQVTGTDTTAALQGPGGVYLSAFSPSTTTNAIVASWDDLVVNVL